MSYKIIQPPFTLKFPEMSRKELKEYFRWFQAQIPERIHELANAVRQTPSYEGWQPDRTPASLDMLGEWLAGQIETRQRTGEEIQEIMSRSVYPIDIPSEELTNRTFSLAVDSGMYLSQVFLQNYPSLRWDQPFENKKHVDYGQPVLADFGPAGPFNPVHMLVTLAYGLAKKTKSGRRLRELYDIWAKKLRPSA